MNETVYLPVKPTQIFYFKRVPFYCLNKDKEYVLYKERGRRLELERMKEAKHPELFIDAKDKDTALKELTKNLNLDLARAVASKGLAQVKASISKMVEEILTPQQEKAMEALPETLQILMKGYADDRKSLDQLLKLASRSSEIVEHTINVLALTLQYAYYHQFEDDQIVRLGLCAMLHDLGACEIDKTILETDKKLTDRQFERFKQHPQIGHDILVVETDFDISVATVALEHHERIDGSGYPNGLKKLSPDSQLISLIDSYEHLAYHSKSFRKAGTPYETLNLIKKEVKQGQFDKEIFKGFASCLVK